MVKEELKNLISQKEAADIRGVSLAAIADLIKRGKLVPIEIGGRKYLRRRDVKGFKPSKGGRPKVKKKKARAKK